MTAPWEENYTDESKPPWEHSYSDAEQKQPEKSKSLMETIRPYAEAGIAFGDSTFGALPIVGSYQDKIQSLILGEPENEIAADRMRLRKENPVSSGIGTATGLGGSLAIPLGPTIKAEGGAAQALARLGLSPEVAARLLRTAQGSLTGGVISGSSNAPDMKTRIENAKSGALWGGGLSGGLEFLQHLLGGKEAAARKTFNSLHPSNADQTANIADKGQSIGRTLLDRDVMSGNGEPGKWYLPPSNWAIPSRETMLKRIGRPGSMEEIQIPDPQNPGFFKVVEKRIPGEGALDKTGQEIGDILSGVNEKTKGAPVIDRVEMAGNVNKRIDLDPSRRGYNDRKSALNKEINDMHEGGSLSISQAQKNKKELQDLLRDVDFDPSSEAKHSVKTKVDRIEKDLLGEELDKAVGKYSPEEAKAYTGAKLDYANLSAAESILTNSVAADRNRGWLSKTGHNVLPGMGLMGASTIAHQFFNAPEKAALSGSIVGGLLAVTAAARKYGPQAAAKFLDMEKNPTATSANIQSIWQLMNEPNRSQQ